MGTTQKKNIRKLYGWTGARIRFVCAFVHCVKSRKGVMEIFIWAQIMQCIDNLENTESLSVKYHRSATGFFSLDTRYMPTLCVCV